MVTSPKDTALDVLSCLFISFHICKIRPSFKALHFVGTGISPKFCRWFAAQGWNYAVPQEDVNALFPRSRQKRLASDRCHDLAFCCANHFHRMRFSGFADGEPQQAGSTHSGSGSSTVESRLWVNEYSDYAACTSF